MAKPASFVATTATLVIVVAFLANVFLSKGSTSEYVPPVQGRNNTALFVVLTHHGLSNVHLATADALLERHPDVQLEFVSYPALEKKVRRISNWGREKNALAKPVGFRSLPGHTYEAALMEYHGMNSVEDASCAPGLAGLSEFTKMFAACVSPWPADEYFETYQHVRAIIEEVDPAVVVLDTIFGPAIDATRETNRLHSFITPNTLVDNFAAKQPWGGFFWKYPVMGSGLPYPIPWKDVPANIYMAVRMIAAILYVPEVTAKQTYLKEHGLAHPIDFINMHRDDAPWITQTTPGASVPIEVVPANVSAVGPITISVAPVEEQDPELAQWLARRPTVFVNLGSSVKYNEARAKIMAGAVANILQQDEYIQVLWKMDKQGDYSDEYKKPLQAHLDSGRLKLSTWLEADPTSILESGHVVAFVHHGGANCYHEAVLAGVPHVILPLWLDLYSFATLVETTGLGVWGCPKTSPSWTPDCISEAVMRLLDSGEEAQKFRHNAKLLGEKAKKMPGRYGAADIIAGLAKSGS